MHIAHSDTFIASLPKSNVTPQAFVLGVFCSNTVMSTTSAVCRGFSRLFFSILQLPVLDYGLLLVIEASSSHTDTPHSVGFLSTSDQPVAETSPLQHTTLTTDGQPRPLLGF